MHNGTEYQRYLASREWAVLREQVRERSGDRCERCRKNPQDAVHHLTYERMGHERLEDLQAICNPCHEFISGKSDQDPLVSGVRIYLAGPITGNLWRDDIIVGGGWSEGGDNNCIGPGDKWHISRQALRGGFDFTGPWFVDTWGGHGAPLNEGTHGDETIVGHGEVLQSGRERILHCCKQAIASSHIVFAWLEPASDGAGGVPAGTLWEMGLAHGLGKTVVAAKPPTSRFGDDFWLACAAADHEIVADDPRSAWDIFCAWWLGARPR